MNMESSPQSSQEQQLTPEERIAKVATFDELYAVIQELGSITSETATHTAEQVRLRIEQVRHRHRELGFITRALRIREKVSSMLEIDPVYIKAETRVKKVLR